MNTIQSNTKFSFPTVESTISRFSTLILNLTLFGLLFSLLLLFVLGPVYGIYKEDGIRCFILHWSAGEFRF